MSDERLAPERALRLYARIARDATRLGAVSVALAAIGNVRDAIAVMQEHAR